MNVKKALKIIREFGTDFFKFRASANIMKTYLVSVNNRSYYLTSVKKPELTLLFSLAQYPTEIGEFDNIFTQKNYFKYTTPKKTDIVIDIGAHIGLFTLLAASKGSKVFSFEPDPSNFEHLLDHLKVNKNLSKLVKAKNYAIWKKKGSIVFYRYTSSVSHSIITRPDKSLADKIKVKTITLNDVISDNNINKIDFLKIDCEGAEYDVLSSLHDENWPLIKHIVMEVHNFGNFKVKILKQLLENRGFKVMESNPIQKKGDKALWWCCRL